MTLSTRHRQCRFLYIALILALKWTGNHAIPAIDEPFNVTQPDGSVIQVVPNGDEWDNYLTDRYGFGVEQDDNGYYVYVDEADTGEVFISSERAGNDGPKDKEEKKQKIHKKKIDCAKKRCGATPEDPKKKTKRTRTLRGTRRSLEDVIHIDEILPPPLSTGVIKNLVVLLHFKDHAEHKQRKNIIPTRDEIEILMNSDEPHPRIAPIGSLKSIYKEVSYGKFTIESTVTEWFVTEHTEGWYADGDSGTTNLHEALRDSLDYLDQNNIINFTDFDTDKDGTIDAITFLHSGYAAEWMAPDQYSATYRNRIWSHKWLIWSDESGRNIGPWVSKDGIIVSDYHISPAIWGIYGNEIGHIGVIAHESGHFIGLDDLYDTNGGGNGLGNYCFMASSWGWDKTQEPPGSMTCWTKAQLGWLTPQRVKLGVNTISDSTSSQDCIKIGDGEYGFPEGEYLLIENRQPKGLDAKIPQGGLAIFHIDESINHDIEGHPGQYGWPLNGRHYKVALLPADGKYDLERRANHGDSGDLFRGDGVDSLLPSEDKRGPYPNTDAYQKGRVQRTGVKIYGISKSNDTMTFIFSDGTADIPSAQPTFGPSRTPFPTLQPSRAPQNTISMMPSDFPTMVPSVAPSSSPSITKSPILFAAGDITMVFDSKCAVRGEACQSPDDCCNDTAECIILEKRKPFKACSK